MKIRNILLTMLVIVVGLVVTGCQPKTQGETFISKSGYFEVVSAGGWIEASEGDLNKNADLELRGKNMEKYAMLLTDKLDGFDNFEAWSDLVISNNSQNYGFDVEDVKTVEVGGYESKYVEFIKEFNGYDMYMRIYFLKSKNFYYQLFLWTLKENKDRLSGEFDNMVNSIYFYEE